MQHNHRVAALIQVICPALLVFCLIERQVGQALGPGPGEPPVPTGIGVPPDGLQLPPHLKEGGTL
ncbi:hypothetical protein AB0H18_26570, partial [Streptomyces sp. NPDC020766]|uniref:hypothetical protein n=1 Tax=Streptomyces sp. NPDC020766 TaxID=3155011 RepID=UPI0033CCBA9F